MSAGGRFCLLLFLLVPPTTQARIIPTLSGNCALDASAQFEAAVYDLRRGDEEDRALAREELVLVVGEILAYDQATLEIAADVVQLDDPSIPPMSGVPSEAELRDAWVIKKCGNTQPATPTTTPSPTPTPSPTCFTLVTHELNRDGCVPIVSNIDGTTASCAATTDDPEGPLGPCGHRLNINCTAGPCVPTDYEYEYYDCKIDDDLSGCVCVVLRTEPVRGIACGQ